MNHYNFFLFSYLAHCKRLDGGLIKLKEASVQLVELNKKLAEQEIVLAEKSAACEALLREISENTEVGGWFTTTAVFHRLNKTHIVWVWLGWKTLCDLQLLLEVTLLSYLC